MKSIKNFIAVAAFGLLILGIPAIASAQYGNGQYDPYGRNGGYNNGQYNDLRSIIRDLKQRASAFQRELDRDLDRSRINGTRREDQMNEVAKRFKNAANRLSESNNGRNDYNRIQNVLDLGSELDREVSRSRINSYAQNELRAIRYDLQILAGSTGNGGYNRNGGYNNRYPGNNNRRNLPSWWPF